MSPQIGHKTAKKWSTPIDVYFVVPSDITLIGPYPSNKIQVLFYDIHESNRA